MTQRGIHIGDHCRHPASVVGADGHHQLCQPDAVLHRFHKGTGAGGDVQQDSVGAGGKLFGHDAGCDQGDAAHGGSHIPQGVHLFIRHGNALALPDDRQTHAVHLCKELLLRQSGLCAGDALHLVDGAAGVTQTSAAHLGDLDTTRRHDGGNDQRGLVAYAAGGMLVHFDAGNGRKIHHDAAVRHHIRKLCGLLVGHAPEIDRHHPRRHLVVRHVSADKTVDDGLQLFPAVGAAIPLFCDQIINAHRSMLLFV